MTDKQRPVFRIHETDWTKEFYTNYERIKKDYIEGMPIKDIQDKHNISKSLWRAYRRELKNDGLFLKYRRKKPRYITYSKTDKRWRVIKSIKSRTTTYLSFREEEDALRAVELFKKYGWDMKNCERVKNEVLNESGLI